MLRAWWSLQSNFPIHVLLVLYAACWLLGSNGLRKPQRQSLCRTVSKGAGWVMLKKFLLRYLFAGCIASSYFQESTTSALYMEYLAFILSYHLKFICFIGLTFRVFYLQSINVSFPVMVGQLENAIQEHKWVHWLCYLICLHFVIFTILTWNSSLGVVAVVHTQLYIRSCLCLALISSLLLDM